MSCMRKFEKSMILQRNLIKYFATVALKTVALTDNGQSYCF